MNLGPDIIKAMTLIEIAQQNGHLPGLDNYLQNKELDLLLLAQAKRGDTNQRYFDSTDCPYTYRLKPRQSASTAIEDLHQNGQTLIECGVAINICYYLVILWQMEKIHGKEKGRKRFDEIFGEKDNITSEIHRLIISPLPLVMGTKNFPPENWPIDPLSFIAKRVKFKSKSQLTQSALEGDMIIFVGSPNYRQKHPFGTHTNYNCIVSSTSPLKVRSFELGQEELTEDEIFVIHEKAYEKAPSTVSMLVQEMKKIVEPTEKSTINNNDNHILGFVRELTRIDLTKLEFLLRADIEEIRSVLSKHHETVAHQLRISDISAGIEALNLGKSSSSGISKDTSKTAPRVDNTTFAGLPGLKGALVTATKKNQDEKPHIVTTNKSTNATQKNDYLVGFKSGFLIDKPQPKPHVKSQTKENKPQSKQGMQNK